MFERFTDRARLTVVWAQDESREMNHAYIGTEHLVLALARRNGYPEAPESIPALIFNELEVSEETVRQAVRSMVGTGTSSPTGHIPFTPRCKKAIELSLREALQLGHNYIGAEHLLLGLLRLDDGAGCQVLRNCDLDLKLLRQSTIEMAVRTTRHSSTDASAAIAEARQHIDRTAKALAEPVNPAVETIVLSTSFSAVVRAGAGFVVTADVMDALRAAASNINNVPKDAALLRKLLE